PSDTPPVQDPTSRFYPWHWSSDSLICVSIAGPAAMMFHLEQLARFPSLENLDLKAITVNRYSLLKTQEEALTKLYSFQTLVPHEASLNLDPIQDLRSSIFSAGSLPVQTEHVADKALIDPSRIQVPEDSLLRGSSKIPATPPLLHSGSGKLRCLGLLGVWESVDPAIWTRILTRFAPHLCELRGFDDLDVFTQIQNIEKAFKAMEEMKNDQGLTREATEEANNEPCWGSRYYQTNRPRKRGLFVELAFGILSESDQEKLGLIEIEKEEKEDYMTRPASRVYELVQTQSYFVLERIQSGTNQDSY
ncbi:hypothetical protein BGW38_010804, partial [Lunasporangiospora selenospora]